MERSLREAAHYTGATRARRLLAKSTALFAPIKEAHHAKP